MSQQRFDSLTRTLSGRPTRRNVLRALASVGLGLGALPWPDAANAATTCSRKRIKRCGRAGKECLINGSCAIVCTTQQDCASGCTCNNPDTEGAQHCIAGQLDPMVACTTTADCPRGAHCQAIGGGQAFCFSLCR